LRRLSILLLTITGVLALTGCSAKETPAQPLTQTQTPVQAKIPVTVEEPKVETYGLTATSLQLLTNKIDESYAVKCNKEIQRTSWTASPEGGALKERILNIRIRLAVMNTTKYKSEDLARADVLKFDHELRELNDWTRGSGMAYVCEALNRNL